ncbi:LigB domain-containing protein [Mycena kentingensis (nom. inval.)]|nr:LigB domain-containing protein [Mycena kentingensis (nom. inval.)]
MWNSLKGPKRCAVPCQGYYEWQTKGKSKTPHFVKPKDGRLMLMAGLSVSCSRTWTFTIVTTQASSSFAWLHERQPVVLHTPEALAAWLDTSSQKWSTDLAKLCVPPQCELDCYAVPPEVGKVGTESPTFIEPVKQRKDGISAMFAKQKEAAAASTSKSTESSSIKGKQSEKRKHESDEDEIEILDRPPTPKKPKPASKASPKVRRGTQL